MAASHAYLRRGAEVAPDPLEMLTRGDGGVCAGRYRLQSSSFEALWLIAEELCRRLQVYFAGDTGDGPFEVKFEETLPLQDFFMLIDAHFNVRLALLAPRAAICCRAARVLLLTARRDRGGGDTQARGELASKTERMGQRAHQFRSVQKRLLVKFKDKNPQPLLHLDLLLDDTCQQLNALSATIDEAQVPTHTSLPLWGGAGVALKLATRHRRAVRAS